MTAGIEFQDLVGLGLGYIEVPRPVNCHPGWANNSQVRECSRIANRVESIDNLGVPICFRIKVASTIGKTIGTCHGSERSSNAAAIEPDYLVGSVTADV